MNTLATKCREAENFDLDALDQLKAAQQPDSDGGTTITPREAQRVRMLVLASSICDNEAATIAEGCKQ